MGNCLVVQEKVIKVMKPDGIVLEYKAPIRVHQVLSQFAGHAISDTLPVVRHLRPDTEMSGGQLYHLLPLSVTSPAPPKKKKRVRFANPGVEAADQESRVVRIKLVISKQELEMILSKGEVSVADLVSRMQHESTTQNDKLEENSKQSFKGWEPLLESIPEVN
ncbi:hypothetical protein NMG60_11001453 [Bertholletia excelsa]